MDKKIISMKFEGEELVIRYSKEAIEITDPTLKIIDWDKFKKYINENIEHLGEDEHSLNFFVKALEEIMNEIGCYSAEEDSGVAYFDYEED